MIRHLLDNMSETSIPCSKALRNRLRECGKKGDSWEKVLTELINDAEKFREIKKGCYSTREGY